MGGWGYALSVVGTVVHVYCPEDGWYYSEERKSACNPMINQLDFFAMRLSSCSFKACNGLDHHIISELRISPNN